jgi:hypothetical protein
LQQSSVPRFTECKTLLGRMAKIGMKYDETELAQLDWYLSRPFVKN